MTSRATIYFQRIGGTGFVLGQIKRPSRRIPPDWWLHYAVDNSARCATPSMRASARSISGDKGAIASALITGKRDAISAPVNDAMYVSSLAHVLSISGYHMAVVAGVVFFAIRASLALIPSVCEPLSDQEMGGARGARWWRPSICCCPARKLRPSAPSS